MRGMVAVMVGVLLQPPATASAQIVRPPASQVEAMKKLGEWVGEWKGAGWAAAGLGERTEFTITESVQPKIQGSILLVEGLGKGQSSTGEEVVVHQALGVLSYDDPTGRYRFRTYDLRGGVIDTELRLVDGGMEWGFRNEERKADLRFTIRLDGDRWHEVGEVSVDGGETWYQMLEMTLERQAVATRSSP